MNHETPVRFYVWGIPSLLHQIFLPVYPYHGSPTHSHMFWSSSLLG
jgi:hypothetical protein